MSKTRGNVVGIDETAEQHGVDAMRLFLLYVTPPEETSNWTDDGHQRPRALLDRVWRACEPLSTCVDAARVPQRNLPLGESARGESAAARSARRREVGDRRNALAALPLQHHDREARRTGELLTAASRARRLAGAVLYAVHALPIVLAPFAPHIADELWERLGHDTSVHLERYLEPDERALAVEEITLVVQVNGKVRARIAGAPASAEDAALALAHGRTRTCARTSTARSCASGSTFPTSC